MMRIVTDVEGGAAHHEPRSGQSLRRVWRSCRPALAVLTVGCLAVVPLLASSNSTGAATLGSLQSQADHLQAEISSTSAEIGELGQKFDEDEDQLSAIENQISITEGKIAADQHSVSLDKVHLRSAAIDAYMSDGTTSGSNPLFSGNQKTFAEQQEYGDVATGNLDVAVDNLHTAEIALDNQEATLTTQKGSAQAAVDAAAAARDHANQVQAQLSSELGQVKGQIGVLEEQAQNQADEDESGAILAESANLPPLPAAGGAATAVQAAETQLGVPYVWGGTSPRGTPGDPSGGFDCSGLVMWAWAQAGVDLPHYSGSQFDDTAPVSVSDMEPGDILFYGPGGSEHEAMYVGGGEMIEAPETGQVVHITPVRLGDGFAGVHRP
jgi:cell wall-associated NlpC family hydrolase